MTDRSTTRRAQANLPVVAVALVVLTAVTGMTVAMAEGAYLSADRDAGERAAAVSAADRLVAADADHTRRANVLDAPALANLTAADLATLAPETADASVRVRVGDDRLIERGDPRGGTTMRRIALVAETDSWRGETTTAPGDELTVPRRTDSVTFEASGGVETIHVNDRLVAHEPSENETIPVEVSRYETITVTADGEGGAVSVETSPETTEKAVVVVTVDV